MTEINIKEAASEATEDVKGLDISLRDAQIAQVEAWLKKFNVRYSKLLPVPLGKINRQKSRANQARERALAGDTVERIMRELSNGGTVPPGVGYKVGDQVVLIDGNHRDEAQYRLGYETELLFVLHPDTPSATILLMTVDANAHHGSTPPMSWRLRQASMLLGLGYKVDQAAEAASVSQTTLNNHLRAERAAARAARLGIKGFDYLGSMVKTKLGVARSDEVFVALSRLVIDEGMTFEAVNDVMRELHAYETDVEKLAHVDMRAGKFKAAKAQEQSGKEVQPGDNGVRRTYLRATSTLLGMDVDSFKRTFLTDTDRSEALRRLNEVEERVTEMRYALELSAKVGE